MKKTTTDQDLAVAAEPSALTVRACDEITFPPGVETLGEKANFLHAYSIEASKRSTGAAILAGWVLSGPVPPVRTGNGLNGLIKM